LHTYAIGAEPHEILSPMVLLEWLREVFSVAYIENLVPMPALAAVAAVGNQVDSADLPKPRVQGINPESILVAGLALERSPA
jgi:hypothetical protein